LKQARKVVVVAVGSQHMPEPGPEGEELARTLERHGLDVSIRTAYGRQKAQGESFLKEAMAAGADLLLKGAYTQSRIRQMIFGGGTRHIIMEAQLPVLMARSAGNPARFADRSELDAERFRPLVRAQRTKLERAELVGERHAAGKSQTDGKLRLI